MKTENPVTDPFDFPCHDCRKPMSECDCHAPEHPILMLLKANGHAILRANWAAEDVLVLALKSVNGVSLDIYPSGVVVVAIEKGTQKGIHEFDDLGQTDMLALLSWEKPGPADGPTPLTDAEQFEACGEDMKYPEWVVPVEHSRRLECELDAARAELARVQKDAGEIIAELEARVLERGLSLEALGKDIEAVVLQRNAAQDEVRDLEATVRQLLVESGGMVQADCHCTMNERASGHRVDCERRNRK